MLFQNIEIAAPSVLGEPDILWGAPGAEITNLTFDNVSIGGKKITSLDHFKHNAYVKSTRSKTSKPAQKALFIRGGDGTVGFLRGFPMSRALIFSTIAQPREITAGAS